MRALLFVIGLVLVAAGVAVGAMSYYSPGEVILGFNLGLAATLLVGGLIVTALSSLIGAVNDLAGSIMPAASSPMDRLTVRPEPEAGTAAIAAVGGVAAASAGAAAATATDLSAAVGETATDVASSAGNALNSDNDALESIKAEVRKNLNIGDDEVETTDTGSSSVGERTADRTGAIVEDTSAAGPEDAFESNSVAARIGAITAGVKAAAGSADDKSDKTSEAAQDTTESTTETLDAVIEPVEDEGADTPEAAGDTTEEIAEVSANNIETQAATETVTELAEEAAGETVEETTAEPDAEALENASDTDDAAATADDAVVETVEEVDEAAADELEDDVREAEAAGTSGAQDQPGEDKALEPEAAVPADGALYVVEETTVRERPARMLSDGTVEAETDAGWMRFENMDHLNEYLDAMSA